MKVEVNIISTRCISMSEAATVPSLMMMTSIVSKESLARDTHTHTDRHVSSKLKFAQSLTTLRTKTLYTSPQWGTAD